MTSYQNNPLFDSKVDEILNTLTTDSDTKRKPALLKKVNSSLSSSSSTPSSHSSFPTQWGQNTDKNVEISPLKRINSTQRLGMNINRPSHGSRSLYYGHGSQTLRNYSVDDTLDIDSHITLQDLKNGLSLLSPESFRDADIDELLNGMESLDDDTEYIDELSKKRRQFSMDSETSFLSGLDGSVSETTNDTRQQDEESGTESNPKQSSKSEHSEDDISIINADELVEAFLINDASEKHSTDNELPEQVEAREDIQNEYNFHSDLITINEITEISSNLSKFASRIGKATAVIKADRSIIIGTSKGFVLVYNQVQPPFMLQYPFKSQNHCAKPPAVVCFDIRENYLVVGYENGSLILWDAVAKSIIKSLYNLFPTAVLQVYFLKEWNNFIACASNKIIKIAISRKLFVNSVDIAELYSIQNESILTISIPLPKTRQPINDYLLLAIGTRNDILVKCIEPQLTSPLFHKKSEEFVQIDTTQTTLSLPYFDWWGIFPSFRDSQAVDQKNGRDIMLGIGWGKKLSFYHFVFIDSSVEKVCFCEIAFLENIRSLKWIDERVAIVIDERNNIILVDPFSSHYIYTITLHNSLIHHCHLDRPVTGMNNRNEVYEYLVRYPSFHYATAKEELSVYTLGDNGIHVITLREWRERLESLIEVKDYQRLFELGLNMYKNDKEAIGTVGFPREVTKAHNILSDYLLKHLVSYFGNKVENEILQSDDTEESKNEQWLHEGYTCIKIALQLERVDSVYSAFYYSFQHIHKEEIFLQALERLILEGKIKQVPKNIMDAMIKSYVDREDVETLDEILLMVNTHMIELNKLVMHCQEKQKYRTLLYAYATRHQYIDAMHALLKVAFNHREDSIENFKNAIDLLFEFLSETLHGHSFPRGRSGVPQKQLKELKFQILFELLSEFGKEGPFFSVLFQINSKLFVKLMIQFFSDISPTNPWTTTKDPEVLSEERSIGLEEIIQQIHSCSVSRADTISYMMNLLDILDSDPNAPWLIQNQKEQSQFFVFVNAIASQGTILLSTSLLIRCVVMITYHIGYETDEKIRIQNQLVDTLKQSDLKEEIEVQILGYCKNAGFHIVCVYLYTKRGEYSNVLHSHLQDDYLKSHVFTSIDYMLKSTEADPKGSFELKNAIINQLSTLISLDSSSTAKLIIDHLYEEHEKVVSLLDSYPKTQYEYLKAILGPNSFHIETLLKEKGISISESLRMKYLELKCRYEPETVASHLATHSKLYPMEFSFNLCKKYDILDAAALLLESGGDTLGSIEMYIDDITRRLTKLEQFLIGKAKRMDPNNENYYHVGLQEYFGNENVTKRKISTNSRKLPRVDDVDVFQLPLSKSLFSALVSLLDMISEASIANKSVSHIWLEIVNKFLLRLRRIHTAFEGKKSSPKWTMSSDNLNFDFSSDTDSSDDDQIVLEELYYQRKQVEFEMNREGSNEKREKLKQDLLILNSNIESIRKEEKKEQHKLALIWMRAIVGKCFKIAYERMIDHVSVDDFLAHVLKKWQHEEIGYTRLAILDALEKISYNLEIHSVIINLMNEENFQIGKEMIQNSLHGIHSHGTCNLCGIFLRNSESSIIFPCGHSFHVPCAKSNAQKPYCVICNPEIYNPFLSKFESPTNNALTTSIKPSKDSYIISKSDLLRKADARTQNPLVRKMFLDLKLKQREKSHQSFKEESNSRKVKILLETEAELKTRKEELQNKEVLLSPFLTDLFGNPVTPTYELSSRKYKNIEVNMVRLEAINIIDNEDLSDFSDEGSSDVDNENSKPDEDDEDEDDDAEVMTDESDNSSTSSQDKNSFKRNYHEEFSASDVEYENWDLHSESSGTQDKSTPIHNDEYSDYSDEDNFDYSANIDE